MRYHTLFILSLLFVLACSPADQDEGGKIMQYDENPSMNEEDGKEEVNNLDEIEIAKDSVQVRSANIGIYKSAAIIVLNWYPEDTDGNLPIDGYYFYVNHQKNLNLHGYYNLSTETLHLTETFNEKETGKMQLVLNGLSEESFWSPAKDTSDKQHLSSQYLFSGKKNQIDLNIEHAFYNRIHKVEMYNTDEDAKTPDVTDELFVSYLNDTYFAFDLHVVRANSHIGNVSGVGQKKGRKGTFKKDGDIDACELKFDFSEQNEITVEEISCKSYHGARAYFDGTYTRAD